MTASNPTSQFWVRLRLGLPGDFLEWTVAYTDTPSLLDPVQVLDGLRIGWALPNEPYPVHPDAVRCSFGLLTADVANVKSYATVGNAVEVTIWDGDPATTGVRWLTFAGRVVDSSTSLSRRLGTDYTRFAISALDFTTDLAEFSANFGARPSESMSARITALATRMSLEGGPTATNLTSGSTGLDAGDVGTTDFLSAYKEIQRQDSGELLGLPWRRYYVRPVYTLGAMAPTSFESDNYTLAVDAAKLPGILAYRDSLISNTFEANLTGWTATDGAAIAQVSSPVSQGLGAARVTGAAAFAGIATAPGSLIPVTVGHSYTARAKVRANTTARNCSVSILYYNAALGLLTTTTSAAVASVTTGYKEMTVTATAPANAVWAQVWCRAVSAVGDIQFWDDPVFTDGVPVVQLELPGSINGDLSEGLVDGCQIDLQATQWASRKRQRPTRVTVTTGWGAVVAEHAVRPAVGLDLSSTITSGYPDAVQAMANMYLPPLEAAVGWEPAKFVCYAGPLVDGLGQAGGRLVGFFPDHTVASLGEQPIWPMLPVVITDVPDAVNLGGEAGRVAGVLASVELVLERKRFRVEFGLRPQLPSGTGASAMTYDAVETLFPNVDYDHVDVLLSYYDSRLARRY